MGDLHGHPLYVPRPRRRRGPAYPPARLGGKRLARCRDRGSDLTQAQGPRFRYRPAPSASGAVPAHERGGGLRGGQRTEDERRNSVLFVLPPPFLRIYPSSVVLLRRAFYQLTSARVSRKVPLPGSKASQGQRSG